MLKNIFNQKSYTGTMRYLRLFLYIALVTSSMWILSSGTVSNSAFFLLVIVTGSFLLHRRDGSKVHCTDFLFAAPFLAVLVGQLLRLDFNLSEYDSPSRLLLAYVIYRSVQQLNPSREKLLLAISTGAAMGLILVLVFLADDWLPRFSTVKSAPNDLGGYTGLLLVTVLSVIFTTFSSYKPLKNWKLGLLVFWSVAVGFGTYTLLGTLTRGAWISTGAVVLLIILVNFLRKPGRTMLPVVVIFLGGIIFQNTGWYEQHKDRVTSAYQEPIRWLSINPQVSSGGSRLFILEGAVALFWTSPLTGFGDFGYSPLARTQEFEMKFGKEASFLLGGQAGPHNEMAARSLQSGIWGLIATVFLLVYPVYRFGRQTLQAQDEDQRDLSFMGFVIFSYIFLLSFVLEPYSLKHTATFNALLLAVLLGATRTDRPAIAAPEKANA